MSDAPAIIRILAVDDHALLREGIAALVSGQPDMQVVAEGSTGREAIQQFRTHVPDITLMDLQMPEMSGLDAMIAIRSEFPNARIIILTTYAGDVQALRAMQAGARGYLLKNLVHKELLDTIRAVRKASHNKWWMRSRNAEERSSTRCTKTRATVSVKSPTATTCSRRRWSS